MNKSELKWILTNRGYNEAINKGYEHRYIIDEAKLLKKDIERADTDTLKMIEINKLSNVELLLNNYSLLIKRSKL